MTSFSGALCLTGICLAGALLMLWAFASHRIMRKAGVILLQEEEYPEVRRMVSEQATALGILTPRLGLVEDLRPNAMVFGRGRSAVLAFSLGLLSDFNAEEVGAVIAHEMMHIKHHDHAFRGISLALAAMSFFNPLAYFSVAAALRERELWADSGAARGRPERALSKVLAKIAIADRSRWLESGGGLRLLFWNDLTSGRSLATHPSLKQRIRLLEQPQGSLRTGKAFLVLGLVWILLLAGIAIVSLMDVRDALVLSDRNFVTCRSGGRAFLRFTIPGGRKDEGGPQARGADGTALRQHEELS